VTLWATYRRALGLLLPERRQVAALTASNVAIGLVFLAEPLLMGRIVDALSERRTALPDIALWAGLGILGILAGVIVATLADRLAHRRALSAMATAFERAVGLPISHHAQKGSGAAIRTIQQGTDCLFGLWLGFMREHLASIVSVALLVPTTLVSDARMAGVLLTLGAIYFAANTLVYKHTIDRQSRVEQYHRHLTSRLGDVLANVVVVQSYTRIAEEVAALKNIMRDLLNMQFPVMSWWATVSILTRTSATIAMVTIFSLGTVLVQRGELTVGQVVSFVGFAGLLIGRLDQLTYFVLGLFGQKPAIDAYFDLLDTTAGLVLGKPNARVLAEPEGRVRYEGVGFRFTESQVGVFDIDLEADPGQTIAVVGQTGSGKTTALGLLQRLIEPDTGRITIDGHDIGEIELSSLRRAIAVVFQDAGMLNRSIEENLRIGKPDATDAQVERAARLAEAHDFIVQKPDGYQYLVGERGASLSGGERQRIAIGRAILKDAPILILDEATSALDVETEGRIKRALDTLRKDRTTFIIAHRLSTIADADTILVFHEGRIVERGTFQELVGRGARFAEMVKTGRFLVPVEAANPMPRPQ
jgi:ATP-binding cassette, subfamily B, beta-glucan exporter